MLKNTVLLLSLFCWSSSFAIDFTKVSGADKEALVTHIVKLVAGEKSSDKIGFDGRVYRVTVQGLPAAFTAFLTSLDKETKAKFGKVSKQQLLSQGVSTGLIKLATTTGPDLTITVGTATLKFNMIVANGAADQDDFVRSPLTGRYTAQILNKTAKEANTKITMSEDDFSEAYKADMPTFDLDAEGAYISKTPTNFYGYQLSPTKGTLMHLGKADFKKFYVNTKPGQTLRLKPHEAYKATSSLAEIVITAKGNQLCINGYLDFVTSAMGSLTIAGGDVAITYKR